ncbi:MAG TPA: hypothetical protein VLF66_00660 [Thermoanaerobaculia bacterium]|nr:hypothetical protein [Thermoanaerobaculia bacterium]
MTIRDPRTDPLGEALRALPRHRPGDGFTGRILDRLGETAPAGTVRSIPTGLRLAAAALLLGVGLLGVLAAGGVLPGAGPAPAPGEARRAALDAERARLEAELAELRRLTTELREESAPVLYLGGDEEVDLVLDLGRLARGERRGSGYRFTNYDQEADRP